MKFVDVVVLLYAILCIVMGILGYVAPTSGHSSIMSLIAGAGVGILLVAALAYTKTNPRVGRISSAVLTLVPLGRFLPAFVAKHNWYPAGIMTLAGIFTFCVLLGGHMAAMAQRKRETPTPTSE